MNIDKNIHKIIFIQIMDITDVQLVYKQQFWTGNYYFGIFKTAIEMQVLKLLSTRKEINLDKNNNNK